MLALALCAMKNAPKLAENRGSRRSWRRRLRYSRLLLQRRFNLAQFDPVSMDL